MLINFESVCRCCLRSDTLTTIFSETTQITVGYDKMMEYLCSVPVTKNDGLSSKICSTCTLMLSESYKFKQKCMESFTELINLKEQICPSFKVEPKLEEIEFDPNEPQCNILVDQLRYFRDEKNNENENSEMISERLNNETDNKLKDEQTSIPETEEGADNIKDFPVLPKIQQKNIKRKIVRKEREQSDEKKATSSRNSKVKKKKNKLTCDECGKSYFSLTRLRDHINWVHRGIKPYHCTICDKDYMHEKAHRETHKDFSATCDKCGKKFKKKTQYSLHMESHGNKEYKCNCGKTFKVKNSFSIHKRLIHGPKKYVCHYCSKAFAVQTTLNDHIRIHTGEKPFVCKFCGMNFRMHKTRAGHINMKHSNARPYECKQCHKDFKTKSILKKHMVIHAERRFACRICKKPFGRLDNCNVHERSVHGLVREEVGNMMPN